MSEVHQFAEALRMTSTIKQYLRVRVEPVELPALDREGMEDVDMVDVDDRDEDEMDEDSIGVDDSDDCGTYPPLILDGASGVGKTQQAFALLKGGKLKDGTNQDPQSLVYVILVKQMYDTKRLFDGRLCDDRPKVQPIYAEMKKATEMESLFQGICNAIREMKEKLIPKKESSSDEEFSDDEQTDEESWSVIFSMASIETALCSKPGHRHYCPSLLELVALLHSHVIEKDQANLVLRNKPAPKYDVSDPRNQDLLKQQLHYLKRKVLFIDEALPSFTSVEARNRLKFMRNFGRILGMRVVLAGTGATAANMRTLPTWPKGRDLHNFVEGFSRNEANRFTWAEVEFVYEPTEKSFKIASKIWKLETRPLLYRWLATLNGRQMETIENTIRQISMKIGNSKKFTNESKFIWLSGACLPAEEKITSPFLLKPSQLVRGHFFEPALVMYKDDDDEMIYQGEGYHNLIRKIGPHRVKITKAAHNGKAVWFLQEKYNHVLAMSKDYSFVEYSLSNCVQICLAREPLFAVAISLKSRYEDGGVSGEARGSQAAKDFMKGFRQALPETLLQRTKGGLDGELHEYVMFAALQLACTNTKLQSATTVEACVKELDRYLKIGSGNDTYNYLAKSLESEFPGFVLKEKQIPQKIQCTEYKAESELLGGTCQQLFHHDVKMPWLVPACDKALLEENIEKYQTNAEGNFEQQNFFGDSLDVAGLIPGTCNSRLDAHAYCWKSYKQNEEFKPDWAFEFRARSRDYSKDAAMKDLMKKCVDEVEAASDQKKRRNAENALDEAVKNLENDESNVKLQADVVEKAKAIPKVRKDKNGWPKKQKPCHGMLIAIVNSSKSTCWYCTVKVGDDKKEYLRVVVLIGNKL